MDIIDLILFNIMIWSLNVGLFYYLYDNFFNI
jgi:hypothetical protein